MSLGLGHALADLVLLPFLLCLSIPGRPAGPGSGPGNLLYCEAGDVSFLRLCPLTPKAFPWGRTGGSADALG